MAFFTGSIKYDNGSITNAHVSSSAAIAVEKLQHIQTHGTTFGTAIGGTPTTTECIVWVPQTSGTLSGFHALLNETGSSTGITFDLKKNGTTVLSSSVSITHSTADKEFQDGSISNAAFVSGDIFSIAMTVSSSTGAQGPHAWLNAIENTNPE